MGATGTAVLDFGPFPGVSDTAVSITGQADLVADSTMEAWIVPMTTDDHSIDEHWVETVMVRAATPVAGSGFTVYGWNTNQITGPGDTSPLLYGKFTFGWVWS